MKPIPKLTTRRNVMQRAASWLWQACEDHQWLPLLVVFILLCIVNSVEH